MPRSITFAAAVNRRDILEKNLLASPCLQSPHPHQILVQEGFSSASQAYNNAIQKSRNELIVFVHQDMILPNLWLADLEKALGHLEVNDPNWGVLGSYGKTQDGRGWGHVYSSGRDVIGEPLDRPVAVQTLDEIVLILRKSSGLRFDDSLPNFHMYGADICLRAARKGMKSYAFSAFCIHNTHQTLVLPKEFYECCKHIRHVWKNCLPIQTTCITITRFSFPLYSRKLKEFYLRHIRRKECGGTRVQDPLTLLDEFVGKP